MLGFGFLVSDFGVCRGPSRLSRRLACSFCKGADPCLRYHPDGVFPCFIGLPCGPDGSVEFPLARARAQDLPCVLVMPPSPALCSTGAVRPRGPCPFFIIPQTRPATCPGRAKAPGGNGHSPPSEACLPGDPAVTWAACVSGVGMGAFLVPEPGALHGLRSAGGGGVRATARNGGEAEAGCLAGPVRPGVRALERFRRAGSAGRVHGGGRGPAREYQQRRGGGVPEGSV